MDLGLREPVCPRCHARLWKHELHGFCCLNGANAITFSDYFKPPEPELLEMYSSNWPYRDPQGKTVLDKPTKQPRASRHYNNMFALPVCEIRSSTSELWI